LNYSKEDTVKQGTRQAGVKGSAQWLRSQSLKLGAFSCRIFPGLFSVVRKRKELQWLNTHGRGGD
jgi:hypothetical protein